MKAAAQNPRFPGIFAALAACYFGPSAWAVVLCSRTRQVVWRRAKRVWPSGPSAWAAILRSRAGPARRRKAKKVWPSGHRTSPTFFAPQAGLDRRQVPQKSLKYYFGPVVFPWMCSTGLSYIKKPPEREAFLLCTWPGFHSGPYRRSRSTGA